MKKHKILIVEDEAIIAMDLKLRLQQQGYEVVPIADSAGNAIIVTKKYNPEVILMDILLKGEKTGIDAAKQIQKEYDIPIIFMTGNIHLLDDLKTESTHPFEILSKPPADWELFDSIEKALKSIIFD